MIKKQNTYLLIVIILVTLLSLWKIGQHDLQEWYESRNGVNAYEMLQNKDYVNYYYNNELDTWNAKPPLMIWLILISYKIFGFNEFALRFPTFISVIIFFIFCFKIIEFFDGRFKAFLCCFILISCKAVFGNHIGLTGDFDMQLTAFLTATVYYFILYIENKKNYAICLFTIFLSLSFYTKGIASFIFFPGFTAYLIIRGKTQEFIQDKKVWFSLFFFLVITCSWILLIYSFGKSTNYSYYGSKNSIETMVVYDTFNRLTSTSWSKINEHDDFFFFAVIDARLNIWNYLFYLSVILGLYKLIENRKNLKQYLQNTSNRLIILSFCILLPIAVILSLAINQNNWYLAPTFMFISYAIVKAISFISEKLKFFYIIVVIVFAFTFIRQLSYLYALPTSAHSVLSDNKDIRNKKIIVIDQLKQNIFLYLEWLNVSIVKIEKIEDVERFKSQMILINKKKLNNSLLKNIEQMNYFDDYCLAKIK